MLRSGSAACVALPIALGTGERRHRRRAGPSDFRNSAGGWPIRVQVQGGGSGDMRRASKRGCESEPSLALDGSLERALVLADTERGRLVRAIRAFGLPRADVDDVVQVAVTEMALNWNGRLACLSVCQLYSRLLRPGPLRA